MDQFQTRSSGDVVAVLPAAPGALISEFYLFKIKELTFPRNFSTTERPELLQENLNSLPKKITSRITTNFFTLSPEK